MLGQYPMALSYISPLRKNLEQISKPSLTRKEKKKFQHKLHLSYFYDLNQLCSRKSTELTLYFSWHQQQCKLQHYKLLHCCHTAAPWLSLHTGRFKGDQFQGYKGIHQRNGEKNGIHWKTSHIPNFPSTQTLATVSDHLLQIAICLSHQFPRDWRGYYESTQRIALNVLLRMQ